MRDAPLLSVALVVMAATCARGEAPDGPHLYRPITPLDLCAAKEVFTKPDRDHLVGTLGSEETAYRDTATSNPEPAISIRMVVDGKLKGVWRRKPVVMSWYVRRDDQLECRWFVKDRGWTFMGGEVPASARLRRVGSGRWSVVSSSE